MKLFGRPLFVRPSPEEFKDISRQVRYRHPLRSSIMSQIGFWVFANSLFILTVWLAIGRLSELHRCEEPPPLPVMLFTGVIAAILYGIVLGLVDVVLERRLSGEQAVGSRIVLKSMAYTVVLLAIMVLVTSTMQLILGREWTQRHGFWVDLSDRVRMLRVMVPFALVGNILMSTLKQVDASFGPGVLASMVSGRYRQPVQERRVFMFMDLRSSTSYAEQLGHQRYSAMIRDLFGGMDEAIRRFDAEVYQYVGDEVVFTWNAREGTADQRCLLFFFAIQDSLRGRRAYFEQEYGMVPEFKAGLHLGEVTAVEIGTIKREIAYHGDAINTAARIQGLCNGFHRDVLISRDVLQACGDVMPQPIRIEDLGVVQLKGKASPTEVHAVLRRS